MGRSSAPSLLGMSKVSGMVPGEGMGEVRWIPVDGLPNIFAAIVMVKNESRNSAICTQGAMRYAIFNIY